MFALLIIRPTLCAGMAELVDAADSKSVACEGVSVRFRLSVPAETMIHRAISAHQGKVNAKEIPQASCCNYAP